MKVFNFPSLQIKKWVVTIYFLPLLLLYSIKCHIHSVLEYLLPFIIIIHFLRIIFSFRCFVDCTNCIRFANYSYTLSFIYLLSTFIFYFYVIIHIFPSLYIFLYLYNINFFFIFSLFNNLQSPKFIKYIIFYFISFNLSFHTIHHFIIFTLNSQRTNT